jgi:predicted N-acetyltransferase YhbS
VGETGLISVPETLTDHHDLSDFFSGEELLDDWLRSRALANQATGASRTFVISQNNRVVGFYALAAGAIVHSSSTGRFRRNMPDPIPVVVLGRLALDQTVQGKGIGRALFRHAGMRTLHIAESIGVRGIVVHAKSDGAHQFYERLGFKKSLIEPMTLMMTLDDVRLALR